MCSKTTKSGWRLGIIKDRGRVSAEVLVPADLQGYLGIVHGGIAATLLDEVMGYAVLTEVGMNGVTQRLRLTFIEPLRVETPYKVFGYLGEDINDKQASSCVVSGEIVGLDGRVMVSANGVFKCIVDPSSFFGNSGTETFDHFK